MPSTSSICTGKDVDARNKCGHDVVIFSSNVKMASYTPTHVHLVGSIGLGGVEEVFRTVGPALGRRLRRIPDGEPGPRRLWVSFQYPLLRSSPFLRPDPSGALAP